MIQETSEGTSFLATSYKGWWHTVGGDLARISAPSSDDRMLYGHVFRGGKVVFNTWNGDGSLYGRKDALSRRCALPL